MATPSVSPAASVLLFRDPTLREVFIVRRSPKLRFLGGFLAFPGGKAISADADAPFEGAPGGSAPDGTEPARAVAAARELFEETGILLARRADGTFPGPHPERDDSRRAVIGETLEFNAFLSASGLTVRGADFGYVGSLVTPEFFPTRFDTAFFVAVRPAEQEAEVWPGELDRGFWAAPAEVLRQWRQGECLVSPPSVWLLETMAAGLPDGARDRLIRWFQGLAGGAIPPIYFAPDVELIPLFTQALPPSTHTNAYLVGNGPVYLLDPGCADPTEQGRLLSLLEQRRAAGRPLTAVVLTHHHPDHVGAAAACARHFNVPVWAHPLTAERLHGKVPVARELHEGDRLPLGRTPGGDGPWEMVALHTPGHAPGHLAFFEPRLGLLFAGDMVSTQTSIVIAPPDGDLVVYLNSLRRLRELPARLLLPAQGAASSTPGRTIDEWVAHREKREEMLLAALAERPRTAPQLAQDLYRGVPPQLMRFAELQVLAGLKKLEKEGRARPREEGAERRWGLASETETRP